MKPEEVHPIAGGRVYSGTQALLRKLADEAGGLVDAVVEGQKRSKLGDKLTDDVTVRFFLAGRRSLMNRLLGLPFVTTQAQAEETEDHMPNAQQSALATQLGVLWQQLPRLFMLLEDKPVSAYWGPVLQ